MHNVGALIAIVVSFANHVTKLQEVHSIFNFVRRPSNSLTFYSFFSWSFLALSLPFILVLWPMSFCNLLHTQADPAVVACLVQHKTLLSHINGLLRPDCFSLCWTVLQVLCTLWTPTFGCCTLGTWHVRFADRCWTCYTGSNWACLDWSRALS